MATSVFAFSGVLNTSTDFTVGSLQTTFDPPANISGKTCYVECTYWNYDMSVSPTPSLTSRDAFLFTLSWAQTVSGTVTDDITRLGRVPMAGINNNFFYSTGPVLCYIPDGPHPVIFTVTRADGTNISNSVNNNVFYALLKITPVNTLLL